MRIHVPRDPSMVAIIQARMGSSRLPGKVLLDIGGKPMLYRVVVRARRAQSVGRVVLATTWDESDDAVAAYCQDQGFPFYRGDPLDVLDRYYQAA
ncbi:MAG: cytidylyltransferase domain-containing protein, partial [Brevefilum sp.]